MNTDFIRLGNIIINVNEISSIELECLDRAYGPDYSVIVMNNRTTYHVLRNRIGELFGGDIPKDTTNESLPEGSFDDSELVKKESLPEGSFDDSEYKDDHYNADGSFNYNNKYGDFPCYE